MAPFIRLTRVASAMCMIGFCESYAAPKAVNHNGAGARNRFGGERQAKLVDLSAVEAETPVSSVNPLMLGMIAGLVAAFVSSSTPAFATGDPAAGEAIFTANCAGCHKGGGNVLAKEKGLTKEALQTNSQYEIDDIAAIAQKGKSSMPAFGQRISAADVENVASYVRAQADKGW